MSVSNSNPRLAKLGKLFNDITRGSQPLTRHNSALFLESVYTNPDAATCVDKIMAGDKGIASLQSAMRFDLTIAFFNSHAASLLKYLLASDLADIGGGTYLTKILLAIVEPPIFWTPFKTAFQGGQLLEEAQIGFAWVLLQLIALQGDQATVYRELAQDASVSKALLSSPYPDVRQFAQRIKHIIDTCSVGATAVDAVGPGGRHDNDFPDFREISILPTHDELASAMPAFLRTSAEMEEVDADQRLPTHLDNQFRLLREDMIYEMREEGQIMAGKAKGRHRGMVIEGLQVVNVLHTLPDEGRRDDKRCKWGIVFKCLSDMPRLRGMKDGERKTFINKDRKFWKHQSMTCLSIDDDVVAFPTVNRVESLLVEKPSKIVLQFEGTSTYKALVRISKAKKIKVLQIDTAVFSYEPILKTLQEKQSVPLSPELLLWSQEDEMVSPSWQPRDLVDMLRRNPQQDLMPLLKTPKTIILDGAQLKSFIAGLTQRVSLIQGPPGTGKSFIGALLAKAIHDKTSQTILVVCYTNHALDQFLEDLMDIGIPESSLVRLGGTSTARTESLSLYKQHAARINFGKSDWKEIDALKVKAESCSIDLERNFQRYYQSAKASNSDFLEHLQFDYPEYYAAFEVPVSADGMQRVGKKGRAIAPDYLFQRWATGNNAGSYMTSPHVREASAIWSMALESRKAKLAQWYEEIAGEIAASVSAAGQQYNEVTTQLERRFGENNTRILRNKRIIACTTTAAAKYRLDIDAACPGVLLVEEAGEILESHIFTALGANTEQLILIGDHKQLRPKVNNYQLTVAKGEGYDLNRSLFERLVLRGFPHETLKEQHRMRPEISDLIRQLTYPELIDAQKTLKRPSLIGIDDNVIFINHEQPEDDIPNSSERKDVQSSKQNHFEVQMILKMVRYLAQQGYGAEKLVVLTPYLGQLRELKEALAKDNDPILNDLDSFDLVRAGLVSTSAAKLTKKPLRLATIDNYQGEESDIVLVSLTRSNPERNIGFMSEPERLNVLLSRARNALIMIGNAETFRNAHKGRDVWTKLLELLKTNGHIYDGLPTRCERHPKRSALLKCPDDFDKECPDGGCLEPCLSMLKCGIHRCPSKCHQLSDHSKMPCSFIMFQTCSRNHRKQWKCKDGPPANCSLCDREDSIAEKKKQKEFDLLQKREADERAHAHKMAQLDDLIAKERQSVQDARLAEERKRALEQKKRDLEDAERFAAQANSVPDTPPPVPPNPSADHSASGLFQDLLRLGRDFAKVKAPVQTPKPLASTPKSTTVSATNGKPFLAPPQSAANAEWRRQKTMEGAVNSSIDAIMEMVGLEDVKEQVLRIKAKVDTSQRQNSDLNGERFNVSMLGNPGTGKTTVARHYARFLASIQVVSSDQFIETTGSRLANDGVPGIKKQLEGMLASGGGTMFVDEAYQLTSDANFQGRQILDFLLAEMENNIGKLVFIFAGYNREMEKFFEHNPGLKSRVPYTLLFKDYGDSELLGMLEDGIRKRWKGQMKVQDGSDGLYARIAIRRLGRGRGSSGFGNARSVHTLLDRIRERQGERLTIARRQGQPPDDFLLTKEDVIGLEPAKVKVESKAWKELQSMIGLGAVKKRIANLFDMVEQNYQRELIEKEPTLVALNAVLLGSPGTGKTTVGKLYGQILADLGLLSNGEVVIKNPADFIGSALGQSESQTKTILANTVGKVLIIDEAYMLYGGAGSGGADSYKTSVIDTIVAEVQNKPGDDRCVLLIGYKSQMEDMFQNVNPGLARRFAMENAFHFQDYTEAELLEALERMMKKQDLIATESAKTVALEVLSRLRNRPNWGNIGDVENLLNQAKGRYQARQASLPVEERSPDAPFEPQDFDPEFNRSEQAAGNLEKLFEDVVGCEAIVEKLGRWQRMSQSMKAKGMDPREFVPTNFVFKGPPGTGKTTTARKMGQVFYDMGFLSSAEVIECSASDLVGQYVGQTGPKTTKQLEKALGRVLFVDEAYRLSEGHFAKEAMDELVSLLTQEKFRAKLVVILAGYTQDMNRLMAVNSGLSSRFPEEVIFGNMSPEHCLEVLRRKLRKQSIQLDALDNPASATYASMVYLLQQLSELPSWGNARDIETLSKQMLEIVFTNPVSPNNDSSSNFLTLDAADALTCTKNMLAARQARSDMGNRPQHKFEDQGPQHPLDLPSPPPTVTHTTTVRKAAKPVSPMKSTPPTTDGRDPNVSDQVWLELEAAKRAAVEEAKRLQEAMQLLKQKMREAKEREDAARAHAEELERARIRAKDEAERAELMRRREQARLQEQAAREERARRAAALAAEENRQREEARVQSKIRSLGVCQAGFQWIKQASGYRCAGGSHFVDNAALGI